MALSKGKKAPDFELPSKNPDNTVRLSDYRGKNIVLLFFPLAFTSVCTDEMCSVSSEFNLETDSNTEVFGISVNSPFTQNEWKNQEDIEVDLLSDFNREVIYDYEVKRDELLGLNEVANRSAFVIDSDGIIQYSWETDDPSVLPNFDEIHQVLDTIS